MGESTIARVKIPCSGKTAKVYSMDTEINVLSMGAVYEKGYLVFCTDSSGTFIVAESTLILGDVNGDNAVNIKDATTIQKHIAKIDTGYPIG